MTYSTTVFVEAAPDAVFDCLVIPEMMVRWMGDRALLQAVEGGRFEVDINGVLIRGHFVRIERPHLIEIAWGEAGNAAMPPGATRLRVTFEARGSITRVALEHTGLIASEAAKHAIGWPHFIERLGVAASGGDPEPDPWKSSPPTGGVQNPPARAT